MIKKIFIIILVICFILINSFSMAEQTNTYSNFQMLSPLLDAVSYASISNNGEVISDSKLSINFVISFLRACRNNMGAMNLTENILHNNGPRHEYVQNHFIVEVPVINDITLSNVIDNKAVFNALQYETEESGLLQIFGEIDYMGNASPAIVKLCPSETNEFGFKIHSLLYNEELSYSYASSNTTDYEMYNNDNCKYSIMIPKLFNTNEINYLENGLNANSASWNISLVVDCNRSNKSINDIIDEISKENEVHNSNFSNSLSMANVTYADNKNNKNIIIVIKGQEHIYTAKFSCPSSDFNKYTDIIDVLINSFSAEELSLG